MHCVLLESSDGRYKRYITIWILWLKTYRTDILNIFKQPLLHSYSSSVNLTQHWTWPSFVSITNSKRDRSPSNTHLTMSSNGRPCTAYESFSSSMFLSRIVGPDFENITLNWGFLFRSHLTLLLSIWACWYRICSLSTSLFVFYLKCK